MLVCNNLITGCPVPPLLMWNGFLSWCYFLKNMTTSNSAGMWLVIAISFICLFVLRTWGANIPWKKMYMYMYTYTHTYMYVYTHTHTHGGALRYYLSHDKTKGRDSLFSFLRGHIASFLPSEPGNISFYLLDVDWISVTSWLALAEPFTEPWLALFH